MFIVTGSSAVVVLRHSSDTGCLCLVVGTGVLTDTGSDSCCVRGRNAVSLTTVAFVIRCESASSDDARVTPSILVVLEDTRIYVSMDVTGIPGRVIPRAADEWLVGACCMDGEFGRVPITWIVRAVFPSNTPPAELLGSMLVPPLVTLRVMLASVGNMNPLDVASFLSSPD